MNCLYSVWDICDDLIFRKVNESDATAFAKLVGCCPPQVWGFIWLLISVAFFAGGILYVNYENTNPASVSSSSKLLFQSNNRTTSCVSRHANQSHLLYIAMNHISRCLCPQHIMYNLGQ